MRSQKVGTILGIFLTLLCANANSQNEFGGWSVGYVSKGAYFYAGTTNSDGDGLAEFCYSSSKSCLWELMISTHCVKNAQYPVLINEESGASSVVVTCTGFTLGDKFLYFFTNFTKIDGAVKNGGWLGVAFPLASDQFSVARFDLNGAVPAIANMRQAATTAFGKTPATGDQVL